LRELRRRKVFFSEEKKQKTSMSLSRFYPAAHTRIIKVFWFFFQKRTACLLVGKPPRVRRQRMAPVPLRVFAEAACGDASAGRKADDVGAC
jgi:hypothetical protein